METLKFKTTIKCTGCLTKVTPYINDTKGVESWEVDLKNLDKVLTIKGQNLDVERIKNAVQEAGYSAESIDATVR
ncbi:MAG: heavy-metal-associated domain-containing protein [Fulvivirga sp.]